MSAMAATDGNPGETVSGPERAQLADLIRERRAELRESLDVFARKAVDPATGTRVTRGWIYRLEKNENVTAPTYEELCALGASAGLPVERLQDAAAAQFFNLDTLHSGTGEAVAYVRKLDQLPADQRARLLSLIDSLVPPQTGDDQ
ncbi:hypothetical protein [Streptomyces sp. NPDC048663]|uniref:hypothetical protein n=1 Tax=Streptomyces sp. NPDC048663 TaxID=3155638 RepID=UPI003428F4F5